MQQLFIAGNVGKDAELRRTQGGDPVCGFSVAVDNGKDKQGGRRESTWYECSLWGKRAESLAPFLKKGGKVTVSGRPTVRIYNDKAYLGISVDQITLQGGNPTNERTDRNENGSDGGGGYGSQAGNYGGIADDEIPF